ncbi:MAG TPA: GDP-L-fucose synthase [Candidatus Binatia bacterium]
MIRLGDKRITVTGGAGFLGTHVVRVLQEQGCSKIFVPRRKDYDFTHENDVARLYRDATPDVVIHLAGVVGGIGANGENPGRFLYENLVMGAMLMEYGRRAGIEKFLAAGTICAYPKFVPVPIREADLWNGYPEETNAPYGLAKRMLLAQGQAYREQYGFNAVHIIPANLYGPGDNFNPASSHVIPATIRKCIEAVERDDAEIVCWGDGTPTREFLYVEDCARALVSAAESYDGRDPVNVGTGLEISIKELVELIAEVTGFGGRVVWDRSKPNGQPRRSVDTRRALEAFGFQAAMNFRDGLRRTVEWYKSHQGSLRD